MITSHYSRAFKNIYLLLISRRAVFANASSCYRSNRPIPAYMAGNTEENQ